MRISARLRIGIFLLLIASLLAACSLIPSRTPTPEPVRTLGPLSSASVPTLNPEALYRPSPGGWIALVRDGDLWLVHPDGSSLKQVTRGLGAADMKLAWSADGQLLAYTHAGALTILDMAGLGATVIAQDTAGGFDWSATAHQIVYDTAPATAAPGQPSNAGLRVISSDGNLARRLRSAAYPVMLNPLWSFDSRRVIFTSPGANSPHLLDAATNILTDLLPGASSEASCNWSPVELLIACLDGAPSASQAPSVLILGPDGKQQSSLPLPSGASHARLGPWSPDGGSLVVSYATGPDDASRISDLLSLDSGEYKKLTPGSVATWSPDSRWVVVSGASAGSQALTVVNTISGLSSPLADGVSPTWQPAARDPLTALTGGTPVPGTQDYCLDASAGFVHKKPKGYYLQFCIGAEKYNYGALAGGVYVVGAQTRYFIYASNSGFAYAARMGDPTLTRIGDFRWFRIFQIPGDPDPKLELRFITGYPALVQVVEQRFSQKDTYRLPSRIYKP